jgi:hypothetical protein
MAAIGPPLTNQADPVMLNLVQQVEWISGDPD